MMIDKEVFSDEPKRVIDHYTAFISTVGSGYVPNFQNFCYPFRYKLSGNE